MAEFFTTYGFLLVTVVQQALLAISLYYPLSAGQLSLATPGFYAVGGYVAAIVSTAEGCAPLRDTLGMLLFPFTWLLAALVSALLAVAAGLPALRLKGIYLALATIAFVEILRVLTLNLEITGGATGIFGIPQLFEERGNYLLIFLPLLLLVVFYSLRLERSRIGRAGRAIREDELAAEAMGIDTTRVKLLLFVLSGVLAGTVGAMSAPFLNTWNARQGSFDLGVSCLAFVLIGGSRSVWGGILGALLLAALPEVLRPLKDSRFIFNGMVLVLVSVYLPNGVLGLLQRSGRKGRPAKELPDGGER